MPSRPTPELSEPRATGGGAGSPWPGLALALAAAGAALGVQALLPAVSALLVAILLGVLVGHLVRLPAAMEPGLALAARRLLRVGVVLLGLQLALEDILGLGWGVLAVVVAVVTVGMVGTVALGRLLRVPPAQALLVAAGFSICGAAAVAAVEGSIEREEEDVATAIGLVVLFGTVMILLAPPALGLSGLDPHDQGVIAGGSVHEVAQVVAVGGILGSGALTVAVVVKLARVLMLAPVVMVLGLVRRRGGTAAGAPRSAPPLVPLFVVGFLAAALARTVLPLPDAVLAAGGLLQVLLLSAAMFALGRGVHVSVLRRAGVRPVALGALSTLLVVAVATGGTLLVG